MITAPGALYQGTVSHARYRPVHHAFSYSVFAMLVDIDALPETASRHRFFSYNRFNLFSFHDRDHGPGTDGPLRPYIEAQLAKAGIRIGDGRIELLCYPRILGYVFNPLSVFYAYDPQGRLAAILYEVSNTFGETHSYVLPAAEQPGGAVRHGTGKRFFVSPFNDVSGRYDFTVNRPGERLSLVIRQSDQDGYFFDAAFTGRRRDLSDRALIKFFFRYPLMTVKVIVAIHWQALRLWRKGMRLQRKPECPAPPVTIATRQSAERNAA